MDPSLPADPTTILPPPTLAQMRERLPTIASPDTSTRRNRRRVPNRSQIGPHVASPLRMIEPVSTFIPPQTDAIALTTLEPQEQMNESCVLDPALTSITQESIQHNVFLEDSKEQIDVASDAEDILPTSVVTSEAPPFPDIRSSSYFRQTLQTETAVESAKISMASSEKTNQDLATEGETDDALKSDNLHNQEVRMELIEPSVDGVVVNMRGNGIIGQKDAVISTPYAVVQSSGVVMSITDQKTYPYFNTSADRLSCCGDSEDVAPANKSSNDNQLLVSGSTFDVEQDLRSLNSPPTHTIVPRTRVSRRATLNAIESESPKPVNVICSNGALKEQSETDNASEITNPYVKKPKLSSHELVTATFNKLGSMDTPDYWAENSNLQQDYESPSKGALHDNTRDIRYLHDPTASITTLPAEMTEPGGFTRLSAGPCNTDFSKGIEIGTSTVRTTLEKSVGKESCPTVSELSEGEKTASVACYEASRMEKSQPLNTQQDIINMDVIADEDQEALLPKVEPIQEDVHSIIGSAHSVALLTQRRAKSCKAIHPSRIKVSAETYALEGIYPKSGVPNGINEASNINDKSNSPLDLTSSIEVPHMSLTESVRQDSKQPDEHSSSKLKPIGHVAYYSKRFEDDPTLFPILPSASAARILGYLDTLLADELAASVGSRTRIPSYKQLILQAIRFRLLTACPELRNCTFDTDDNRTNLARFCRDLLASLPNPNYSSLPEQPKSAPKALEDVRRELLSSPPETVVGQCLDNEMYDHALYLAIVSGNSDALSAALAAFEGYVYSSIDPTLSLLYSAYATRNRQLRWSTAHDDITELKSSHFKGCSGHNLTSSTIITANANSIKERPPMLTTVEQSELYKGTGLSMDRHDGSLVSLLRSSEPGSSIRRQYATFTAADILHKIAFSYIHVLTKEERNDVLVSLLVYSREASENRYIRALLCILLGIPPIYDSYGRFCFTDLFPIEPEQSERQNSQLHVSGAWGAGGRHSRSEVSNELESFLQKLSAKNIQSVDLFTFRIHEILEYIHFRTTNIPHELFYQATKPVLLSNYGFYHSYKYDLTFPFFCHLLPYKLAFAGFLRKESRTNDTLARHGLLYTTMTYSTIEQVISRVNLSDDCMIRKDSVIVDSNTLLMKPSCLVADQRSTPINEPSAAPPDYPLGFDYPAIVAPIEYGDVFINVLRLASNYKKELRSKASISAKYIKDLMLISPEAIESIYHLQKEAYNWIEDLICEPTLRANQRTMLKQIQSMVEGIDIDCIFTSDFSNNYISYKAPWDNIRETSLIVDDIPVTRRQNTKPLLKNNNMRKRVSMGLIEKDSHDDHECSENGANVTNRSPEPSITDKGRTGMDCFCGKEPEFLFQAFMGYTGGKAKFQRCTMLHEDTSDDHNSSGRAEKQESEESSLDFGVHSEFDNESFDSDRDDATNLGKVILNVEPSGSMNVINPSVIQHNENYRSQTVTRSSLTPAPGQVYGESVTIPTTTLIKAEHERDSSVGQGSISDTHSTHSQAFTTSVIQNPSHGLPTSVEPVITSIVDNPPKFPSIAPERNRTAAPSSPTVPPGFRGKGSEVALFEQDMSSDEYSSSSEQDIVPSGRSPAPVIQIDPLSTLSREIPTQPLIIPPAPLNVTAVDVPGFSVQAIAYNTSTIPEIDTPINHDEHSNVMPSSQPLSRNNVPALISTSAPASDYSERKACQDSAPEQQDKHPQPMLFNFFKASKSKQGSDDVAVVDLKANSTGKMAYSKVYECWVTLDEKGNEIPPPVQKDPTPPPVVTASHQQFNSETSRKASVSRAANRTAASRYKLVRE